MALHKAKPLFSTFRTEPRSGKPATTDDRITRYECSSCGRTIVQTAYGYRHEAVR